MRLVRTSIAVASVCAVLGWSAESFAQSAGDTDTGKQDTKDTKDKDTKKTTKTTKTTKKTTKKSTDTSGSSTSGSSDTSASGTTGSSGSTTSGTTGTAPVSPPSPSPSDGSGTTGTSGTGTTGSGMTGGTGIPSGSDTSGTMGTGTTGTGASGTGTSPYDTSGSTYPLGTQPNMQQQGAYGTQGTYGQPGVAPTPQTQTSTTQTTSAMYDTSVTADRAEEYKVRPNRPLLVTGSAIFLGSYAATAIQGAVSPLDADRKNLIPVAGPWINMSERPCNLGDNCSTGENINNVLLIGSGVAQGAGIAIALISLAVPETHERVVSSAKAPPPKSEWRVIPAQMGRGGAGAFAVGTF